MAENHKLFNNEKINVYEAQDEVAIDVFDISSSGTKPDGAILVTTGSYVPGAISVNVTNKIPGSLGVKFVGGDSPVPPGPSLPPYTIRLKYKQGTTPTFSKGTGVLYDAEQNIWDLTYENTAWIALLSNHTNLLEVIEANTEGVVNMNDMLYNCSSLTSVSLFDTSSVTYMKEMLYKCTSLISVPLFNTSNVTDISFMLYECTSLKSVPLFDTSKVTNMASMLRNCTSLASVPLFDTSKVATMSNMFNNCTSLKSVPLFDTSKVTTMNHAFKGCYKVQSGALALYQQASTQTTPPTNHTQTFTNCGRDTETGAAELAQIPSDWK